MFHCVRSSFLLISCIKSTFYTYTKKYANLLVSYCPFSVVASDFSLIPNAGRFSFVFASLVQWLLNPCVSYHSQFEFSFIISNDFKFKCALNTIISRNCFQLFKIVKSFLLFFYYSLEQSNLIILIWNFTESEPEAVKHDLKSCWVWSQDFFVWHSHIGSTMRLLLPYQPNTKSISSQLHRKHSIYSIVFFMSIKSISPPCSPRFIARLISKIWTGLTSVGTNEQWNNDRQETSLVI